MVLEDISRSFYHNLKIDLLIKHRAQVLEDASKMKGNYHKAKNRHLLMSSKIKSIRTEWVEIKVHKVIFVGPSK